MKVSVNWLRQLVDIDMSVDQLAHTLTMAGLEVEAITPVAAPFQKIVVAEVKTAEPHPNADKLRVTTVDTGTGPLLQIVCGAPNVTVGMRVPCALVGAQLPGLEIKQAKLRGVESNGMLCSARELGLSQDHSGLLVLPTDAPIGEDIRRYLELDDIYLTLKLTPNRGDCLSMLGVARDLAAVTSAPLTVPPVAAVVSTCGDIRKISLLAEHACNHYCGRIIKGLNPNAPTPDWMKRRLERAGFRTISPLVDITNYVMLERGNPMHAFDNDKLKGDIQVRFAVTGEDITLLNEQSVNLNADMLLITDESSPIAMGGVMGGYQTMVGANTHNIFLEAAYFAPSVIQGKTRLLELNSDAAYRFERGVDPTSMRDALERATQLAIEICGTDHTLVGPIAEEIGKIPFSKPIVVRPQRVKKLIGVDIPQAAMVQILQGLHCKAAVKEGVIEVTAPPYRFDLTIEEDFVEEIARIYGYEKIPASAPISTVPILALSEAKRSRMDLRRELATYGYQEVINYSFIPSEWEADFSNNINPLRLANPIANHMAVMRSSLIGGLIASLKYNLNHGESRVQLFEMGRCFLADETTSCAQPERLAGLAYGSRFPEQWGEDKSIKADFFSLKGDVETLLDKLKTDFRPANHPALHPGRAAEIHLAGKQIGIIGELHPSWQQKYDLPMAPVVFELDVASITDVARPQYQAISRMPTIRRDIAILAPEKLANKELVDTIKSKKIASIVDFSLFDLFRGATIENGRKSLAFRIVMQDTDRTLTDIDADQVVADIIDTLHYKFDVTIRK